MEFSPVIYLLGAGASADAKVPTFKECWGIMNDYFGFSKDDPNPQSRLSKFAFKQIKRSITNLPEDKKNDFELLCKSLRTSFKDLIKRDGPNDQNQLEEARGCIEAEYAIRDYFVRLVDIDYSSTLDHDKKGQYFNIFNQRLTDIFSLNNDLLMEYLAERKGLPICDGFSKEGIFSTGQYIEVSEGIRLYKLHGSINWRRNGPSIVKQYRPGSFRSFIRFGNFSRQTWNIPLVWPGVYEEMREMENLVDQYLVPAVKQARCLVIVGYKMGDPKIIDSITSAIQDWPKDTARKVVVVCGNDYTRNGASTPLTEWIDTIREKQNVIIETRRGFYQSNGNDCDGSFPNILTSPQFIDIIKPAFVKNDDALLNIT